MCALISIAVFSTDENKKDECLAKTLKSLDETVNFKRHRLMLSVNGATEVTKRIIHNNRDIIEKVFWNETNLGTAEAINLIWKERKDGEHCIKEDDDIVIHQAGWLDILEDIVNNDPSIGQAGLKRKDCIENPSHPDPYYRSELKMLNHIPGHKWLIVEQCSHVMGSCVLHSSALLDKVGYLYQPKKYGWDDVLMSARSIGSGFKNVFYPHIEIDHIDDGSTPYQGWKERVAMEDLNLISGLINDYKSGAKSCYYNPFEAKESLSPFTNALNEYANKK